MLYNQYTPASQWLYKATGAVTRCQIPERCDYNWKKLKRNQANNQREKNQKADVPEFYTTSWNFAKLWVREQRKLSDILLSFGYGEYRQAFGHCTRREKAICNSRKSTLNGFWKAVCYRGYSPRGRADPKQHTERHALHCATHDWPEGANVTIFLSSTYHMERLESPQSALKCWWLPFFEADFPTCSNDCMRKFSRAFRNPENMVILESMLSNVINISEIWFDPDESWSATNV